ncbi:MAG: 3-oxoacyl-[acyl-carrier protein] reductase [Microgenomates group bacterium Gr01-1014_16]|nr:MAG: 3-oxoacyl-[acyl-carrier protein] reductase [Microgenomates group bacterium Gr01-1014_16]
MGKQAGVYYRLMDRKVVFITGASRGIGAACVRKFSDNGWNVAGFYKQTRIENTETVKYYQCDVADASSVQKAFDQAFADFGRIDCLVNNAGIFGYKKYPNVDEKMIDEMIGINEKGVYWCTKSVLAKMESGSIISVSSTVAQVGGTDPMYSATKAAILGFTKSLAKVMAPKIRVNAVAPGATDTDMMKNYDADRKEFLINATLLKKIAQPEDVANGIYFLASEEAGHITGACLDINGGYVLR